MNSNTLITRLIKNFELSQGFVYFTRKNEQNSPIQVLFVTFKFWLNLFYQKINTYLPKNEWICLFYKKNAINIA